MCIPMAPERVAVLTDLYDCAVVPRGGGTRVFKLHLRDVSDYFPGLPSETRRVYKNNKITLIIIAMTIVGKRENRVFGDCSVFPIVILLLYRDLM